MIIWRIHIIVSCWKPFEANLQFHAFILFGVAAKAAPGCCETLGLREGRVGQAWRIWSIDNRMDEWRDGVGLLSEGGGTPRGGLGQFP